MIFGTANLRAVNLGTTNLGAVNFLAPDRLWLLVAVALLGTAYVLVQLRRRSYAVRFTNVDLLASVAPKRPGWRRHVPAGLYLLALAVLVVGIARPTAQRRVPRERATIIMAIDTSLSMQATDVAPNRIEAAQAAAKSFAEMLPPKINLGLVTFNGNASLKVAPTTDREAINRAIDNIQLGERTAIGEAIFTSLEAIASVPTDPDETPAPARIVLMSDGETTWGRDDADASQAALDAEVPVSTIAFGTDEGFITIPQEQFPIPVPVNHDALKAIADATGGMFYSAATGKQLTSVYENIGSSIGYTTEPQEVTDLVVAGALMILVLGGGLSMVWFSRLP